MERAAKQRRLSDVEPGKHCEWVKGELDAMEYSEDIVTKVCESLAGYTRESTRSFG